jgi:hypothetical protein
MEPFLMQPPFKSAARATHAGEELLYVLSGEIDIKLGAEDIFLIPAIACIFHPRPVTRSGVLADKKPRYLLLSRPPQTSTMTRRSGDAIERGVIQRVEIPSG